MIRISTLFFFLFAATFTVPTLASQFYACQGKYALCTTAKCTPVAGKKDIVSCQCDVKHGYSAATEQCKPVKQTKKGEIIYSRYYPIKSYVACTNHRPWAWCLDKVCLVDKDNPSQASCACRLVSEQPYIIVTDKSTPATCTTDIISSATVKQANDITRFLKTQSVLKPFHIKALKNE